MKMIYLASPYSHKDPDIMEKRFEDVCKAQGELIKKFGKDHVFIGPIAMSHSIAQYSELNTTWEFWQHQDEELIKRCDEVWLIKLDGWQQSKGVRAEIDLACKLKKPIIGIGVEYVD